MNLAGDVAAALPFLRQQAESLMVDRCLVERPSGSVVDPETGEVVPGYVLVWEGRCRVQQTLAQSSSPEAGGAVFTVQDSQLQVPVGVGPFAVGDRVTLVGAVWNPALLGNVYRVTELFEKTHQTSQRLRVEELV